MAAGTAEQRTLPRREPALAPGRARSLSTNLYQQLGSRGTFADDDRSRVAASVERHVYAGLRRLRDTCEFA